MPGTRRQHELLQFIAEYSARHGYSPSYEEMSVHLGGRSLSTVHGHVHALIARGFLRRNGSGARHLEVIPVDHRPYPEFVATPAPENGFEIPPGTRYVLLSSLPRLFAHWAVRGLPSIDGLAVDS